MIISQIAHIENLANRLNVLLSNTNPTEVLKVMRKLEANNNVLSKSNMINFLLKIMEMCSLKLWNTILDMSWRVQTYTTFTNN